MEEAPRTTINYSARSAIAQQTREFLSRGGTIEIIKSFVSTGLSRERRGNTYGLFNKNFENDAKSVNKGLGIENRND